MNLHYNSPFPTFFAVRHKAIIGQPMSTSNPTDRYHSLDFLRAVAMYLGVILHVTILFGSPDRILWSFYG